MHGATIKLVNAHLYLFILDSETNFGLISHLWNGKDVEGKWQWPNVWYSLACETEENHDILHGVSVDIRNWHLTKATENCHPLTQPDLHKQR